jgi:AraC family transcriptional regulator, ethanolamine operon transcriptional activator
MAPGRLEDQHSMATAVRPPAHSRVPARQLKPGDPVQFTSTVGGFQLDLMQIDCGPFIARGSQACVGRVLVSNIHLGRAAVQTWISPPWSFTVALKTTSAMALWRGIGLESSDILLVGPNTEIELVTKAGFGAAAATFFGADMRRAAELCGFDGSGHKVTVIRSQQPLAVDGLRREIGAMLSVQRGQVPSSHDRDRLLHRAVLSLAKGVEIEPGSGNRRTLAIERSLHAIKNCTTQPIRISELCKVVETSERTLRGAFMQRYLLPPARFIKAYRLNQLRKELARFAKQGLLITEIANERGFQHLGQLAKDYRAWFGELPSATYRRHLPHLSHS